MAIKWTIGGDALEPQVLARFWAAASGTLLRLVSTPRTVLRSSTRTVSGRPSGSSGYPSRRRRKNRLHIDIRGAGPEPRTAESATRMRAKAAELVGLGATVVREEFYGDELGHVVMLDPEGNEFCVG